MIVEDNSLYSLNFKYTDWWNISHYELIFEWESYCIRIKKKDIDKLKEHIVAYIRRYRKRKEKLDMPFKLWLKTFKEFYY